jgi:crotonobetainyl-CoA:carnitine CoA-transferase CaiB-like acyl-CoA transferase
MVMTDHVTGLIAAQAIGFALYRRERTGRGEAIEVPMLENMASFVTSEHMGAATFVPPTGESGDNRLLSPDYRPLPTKDGYITISPNTDAQAFAFFAAIGRPELKDDPRFRTAQLRSENAADYFEVRAAGLLQKSTAEWLAIFDQLEIPAARYNGIDDLFDDPHLADVGFFETEAHPSEGTIRRTRVANTYSGGMREDRLPAPRLGEHTADVLRESGYPADEIERMIRQGSAKAAPALKP